MDENRRKIHSALAGAATAAALATLMGAAQAQGQKPNIILIVSDDTGLGDLGPYGGGAGRGMPTPKLDRLASEGMQFDSFYSRRCSISGLTRRSVTTSS